MSGIEDIAAALGPLRKAGHPAQFPKAVKAFPAPGQYLMRVGLMTYVPDHPVPCGVKSHVKGDRQLHHSQVGGEVSACHGQLFDQELADLLRQLRQLLLWYLPDIVRVINLFQ